MNERLFEYRIEVRHLKLLSGTREIFKERLDNFGVTSKLEGDCCVIVHVANVEGPNIVLGDEVRLVKSVEEIFCFNNDADAKEWHEERFDRILR